MVRGIASVRESRPHQGLVVALLPVQWLVELGRRKEAVSSRWIRKRQALLVFG